MMTDQHIQHLLKPSHITSPDAMLFYYTQSIICSQDPVPQAVNRVMVELGTVSKNILPPQHEFVIFNVKDSKNVFPNRKIITECTVNDMPKLPIEGEASRSNDEEPDSKLDMSLIKAFFEHPKSKQFLKVIQQNICTKVNTPAEDHFLEENFLSTKGLGMGHNVWSHKPDHLNLLMLILLVCVVHEEHPLYSILGDQCYWFAHIILTALQLLFSSSNPVSNNNKSHLKKKTGVVFMPFYYLPGGKVAGRFWGVKVSAVEDFVLATVCDLFRKRYDEEMAKASSHSPLNYYYLLHKFLTDPG